MFLSKFSKYFHQSGIKLYSQCSIGSGIPRPGRGWRGNGPNHLSPVLWLKIEKWKRINYEIKYHSYIFKWAFVQKTPVQRGQYYQNTYKEILGCKFINVVLLSPELSPIYVPLINSLIQLQKYCSCGLTWGAIIIDLIFKINQV